MTIRKSPPSWGKKRIVYSAVKTNQTEKLAVERLQDTLFYVCGSVLYPEEKYKDKLICREGITCQMPIESQYYSGIKKFYKMAIDNKILVLLLDIWNTNVKT